MLAQLKRDPLLGWPILKWMVIAALNASVVFGVVTGMTAWSGDTRTPGWISIVTASLLMWLPAGFIFFLSPFGRRCNDLDLGLPIHAKRLWLSHLIAALLAGGLLLVSSGGLLVLTYGLAGRFAPGTISSHPPLARLALPCAAALLITVVVLQSRFPSRHRIPRNGRFLAHAGLMLAAGYFLILLLSMPRVPYSIIVIVFALTVAYRTYHSLPPAFAVVPRESEDGEGGSLSLHSEWEQTPAATRGGALFFPFLLTRAMYQIMSKKRAGIAAIYLFLIVWGLLISGLPGMKLGWNEDLALYNLTLTLYTLLVTLAAPLARMYPFDPLPVSRRFLFAFLVWPPLLALSAGYFAGQLALPADHGAALVQFQQEESPGQFPPYPLKYPAVRVPAQFCRIAWDGKAPQNTSPWGEAHDAWQMPLFKGSRITVYSPFSTPRESSAAFVALQLSRAIETVYGQAIPPEVVRDRYLTGANDGVVFRQTGLSQDYPDLQAPRLVRFYPTLALATVLAWLTLMMVYLRTCRASLSDGVRKVTFIGILGGALVIHLLFVVAFVTQFIRPDAVSAFWRILAYQAGLMLPGGDMAVWLICALVFAGAYWLAQRVFERIEMPTPRTSRDE